MKKNITLAKKLRKRPTEAEKLVWRHLRGRQIEKMKFRRQQTIGDSIVDFVCFEKNIIIEIDGGQHAVEAEKDYERDRRFRKQGFKVLRFWNNEVMENIEGVLEIIRSNV